MQSQRKNRKLRLWAPAALLLAAGSGWYWQARSDTPGKQGGKSGQTAQASVRTVRVVAGGLERTIRLMGTTTPERYASLLTPQLRGGRHGPGGVGIGGAQGSRGDRGSGSSSGGSGGGSGSSGSSGGGSAASSAGSASAASSAGGATAGGAAAGAPGAGGSLSASSSAQLRSSLSRFSAPASSSARRSAGGINIGTTSLGSTASSLPGGGGGGGGMMMGGGDDFSLVLQTLVKPGSRVKKGQVIAEFDRQYMLLRLDDFRASQVALDTQLQTLRTNLEVEKTAERQSIDSSKAALEKAKLDLKTIPVQSANTSERLKLAAEEAEANHKRMLNQVKFADSSRIAELRIAQLERDQQALELKRSEANADRMVIKAPMNGITVMGITFRGGDFGQIQAGDQLRVGQMFMKVVDLSSMVIESGVNQVDVEEIRVGQKAHVRFDAYPDLDLPAHVHAIGAMSKNVGAGFRASFVREVPIILKLDRLEPRVIPDLSVSVDVVLDSQAGATLAPLQSIFQEEGKRVVFVQTADGWELREVELGLRNNLVAAIRSGLRPGEVIAAERPPEPNRK